MDANVMRSQLRYRPVLCYYSRKNEFVKREKQKIKKVVCGKTSKIS